MTKPIKVYITNTRASARPARRIVWQDGKWYSIEVKAWDAAPNATIRVGDSEILRRENSSELR